MSGGIVSALPQVTRLASGLTVASDFMPGLETISLGLWVDVGTRHEPAPLNGVSHMLEHMAFKGTARRSARDIAVETEAVGGQLNAYTSRERTCYYGKFLAVDWRLALDVLADIVQHSVFAPDELEREKQVILQEIGQAEDTPDDIVFDYFQEIAFPDQPLGRPVLGRAEIVARLDREQIRRYQSGSYGPAGMVLAAAGQIDHAALCAAAAALFDALPQGRPEIGSAGRYAGGERRERRDLEQVHLLLGFPGVGYRDPDYYAQSVYATLLGGGMSSRLFQEVREKRGLVYSIYSYAAAYLDCGLFGIYAGTGEAETAELMPLIAEELARAPLDLGEEEIRRAKAQIKADLMMARESTHARAESAAQQIMIFGRPLSSAEILARVEAVDRESLARFGRRLNAGPAALTAMGPIDRLPALSALTARLAA